MNKDTADELKSHFTPRTILAGLGMKLKELGILDTIGEYVQIKQKTVLDSPLDKLTDSLITILAGGKGMVETNHRVRPDRALQLSFGRERCAEQSVISETFNACTSENVEQMGQACQALYQRHSQGFKHPYQQDWQLLDVDLCSQPCGVKAAFATGGYFARQRNRRGRQLGRVLASWYEEIVVDQLYPGNITLTSVLPELLAIAEEVLALDRAKRRRTILRIDGHGGSQALVKHMLERGYQILTKEYGAKRAAKLAATVSTWYDDPKETGRQVGWVGDPTLEQGRRVYRIAVRTPKKNGQWGIGVLVTTLTPLTAAMLAGFRPEDLSSDLNTLLAYVYAYDLRGGGIETAFRQDRQALGIAKRNKKSFQAQFMLTHLNALAHNLLVWSQHWFTPFCPAILQIGLLRLVRDILQCNGRVFFDPVTQLPALIVLSDQQPWAPLLRDALRFMLDPLDVVITLAKI